MIDLSRLRQDPQLIVSLLKKKDPSFDGMLLYALDEEVRRLKTEVDTLRSQKNELARAGQKGITPELREQSKQLSEKLKEIEEALQIKEKEFKHLYLLCPNIILESVPEGNKENNLVVKEWGEKPAFTFTPKNHVELGDMHGWFDFRPLPAWLIAILLSIRDRQLLSSIS